MDGVAFFSIIIPLLIALLAIGYYFFYKHGINKKLRNRDYENDQAKPFRALSISQFLLAAGIVSLIIVIVIADRQIDGIKTALEESDHTSSVNTYTLSNQLAALNQKVGELNQMVVGLNETLQQQDNPFKNVQVEYGKFDAATSCGEIILHLLPKENITPVGVIFEDEFFEFKASGAEYTVTIPINIFTSHYTGFYINYKNASGNTAFHPIEINVDLMRKFMPRFHCYISHVSDSEISVFLNYENSDSVSIIDSGFAVYVDGKKIAERQLNDIVNSEKKEFRIAVNSSYSEVNVIFTCHDSNGFTYIGTRGLHHDNLQMIFLSPWIIYNQNGDIMYDNYN